jgi:hypothetical protein
MAGGPKNYTGPNMFAAHAKLIKDKGLNLGHFYRICIHLLDTLIELGVPQKEVRGLREGVLTCFLMRLCISMLVTAGCQVIHDVRC